MKKWSLAFALLIAVPAVEAAEYAGNPDRYPSIGINYTGSFASGDLTFKSGGLSASQDAEFSQGVLALDTRIPVSNSVTLNGAIGFIGETSEAMETNLLDGSEADLSGAYINLGIRFYIK